MKNWIKPLDLHLVNNKVILDCSYFLSNPALGTLSLIIGYLNYKKHHIPMAKFFDLDLHSNKLSSFPHMLPSPNQFKTIMDEFGIKNDSNIILYDQGLFSAPRF